jgi:hypothetical protein
VTAGRSGRRPPASPPAISTKLPGPDRRSHFLAVPSLDLGSPSALFDAVLAPIFLAFEESPGRFAAELTALFASLRERSHGLFRRELSVGHRALPRAFAIALPAILTRPQILRNASAVHPCAAYAPLTAPVHSRITKIPSMQCVVPVFAWGIFACDRASVLLARRTAASLSAQSGEPFVLRRVMAFDQRFLW